MTTYEPSTTTPEPHDLRLHDPGDLLEAVPYLIGFHPRQSLVVVGIDGDRVAVTVRTDLIDVEAGRAEGSIVEVLVRAGVDAAIVVVYLDAPEPPDEPVSGRTGDSTLPLPRHELVDELSEVLLRAGVRVVDSLLVCNERWWSYLGRATACECCVTGTALPGVASAAAASAVFAGLVAHPSRAALAAVLEPEADDKRERRRDDLVAREDLIAHTRRDGLIEREQRSVKRALFAAAREADTSLVPRVALALPEHVSARYAVALTDLAVRDPLWLAIDQGRVDGRGLWQTLLRTLPSPYDCAPLFLYGWASWREGQGSLAAMAAERALRSDPAYTAAQLLLSAVTHGLDPFRTPRLRMPIRPRDRS